MIITDNPFRPGAGHQPMYLAGRDIEKKEFQKSLEQKIILQNVIITGLRGIGKTVLLDSLKKEAIKKNWLWIGADLSESVCLNEENMIKRLCTDLSIISSSIVTNSKEYYNMGFEAHPRTKQQTLDFNTLLAIYESTPGLSLDKIKKVIEIVWNAISSSTDNKINGIIFAYDEAQNLSDQAVKEQYPLAILLDAFQSLQKQNMPVMLVLSGLPTLFPKMVESRTFAERMFKILPLNRLNKQESEDAILKPIKDDSFKLDKEVVNTIFRMSGGYPYFIQFICKEIYDFLIQKIDKKTTDIPFNEIERKLDVYFFASRWANITHRQQDLLVVVAGLNLERFSVQEVFEKSKTSKKPFSNSHINQMFNTLITIGLLFKHKYGKYSFAVPLLGKYIIRDKKLKNNLSWSDPINS